MEKIPVGILGATGTVGQKFVTLLEHHPQFVVRELVASHRSAGKRYDRCCQWRQNVPMPSAVESIMVQTVDEPLKSPILFSGMDSAVAGEAEDRLSAEGHLIISNSRNHRMDPTVPLVIPEVNWEHFALTKKQKRSAAIITNSNCATMFLAMVLAPLHRNFTVEAVHIVTMQAVSGAGYPGVASVDILGNILPYIDGEEEKIPRETNKILGTLHDDHVESSNIVVSPQCNRVPVQDGHTASLSIRFKTKPSPEDVSHVLKNFSGKPQELGLHFAPKHPILVFEEEDRPQPLLDIYREKAMAAYVGRIQSCQIADIKMTVLGHNTIRGAAGAAILNAESYLAAGYPLPPGK